MNSRREELRDTLSKVAKHLQESKRLVDDASRAVVARQQEHIEKIRDHLVGLSDAALRRADDDLHNLMNDLMGAAAGFPAGHDAREALEHAADLVGLALGEDESSDFK
jgi:hypothetical protein